MLPITPCLTSVMHPCIWIHLTWITALQFLALTPGWVFLPQFIFIELWVALSSMPPLEAMNPYFSWHRCDISSCPNVWNCVSKFTWNWWLTSPVFRDSTSTTLLECISDIPKYNTTLYHSDHFLCGCMAGSALYIKYNRHKMFSIGWSLGQLGIMKIPPLGYSCQGSGSSVSRSSRYYPCTMHTCIGLLSLPLPTSLWHVQ